MTGRRLELWLPLAAALAVLCLGTAWAVAGQTGGDAGAKAGLVGPTPPNRTIRLLLVLRLREQALTAYLRRLYDPKSPEYQHYGDAAAFGRRFGLSSSALAALDRTLRSGGLRVVERYPQRTALRVSGPAADVERVFAVTLHDYRRADGTLAHAPDRPARVPPSLAGWVRAVADLDTRQTPQPVDVPAHAPGALLGDGALAPGDAAAAYDLAPLYAAGIDGQNQTLAVVSFDSFVDTDVSDFANRFHLGGPAPSHVAVDGGTTVGNGHVEVNLDVQVAKEIAPQARILSYEAPGDATWADVFNRIFAGSATIVTNSWGICESAFDDPSDRLATEQALQVAAFKGVTVFSASGDAGAYDCQRSDFADRSPTVEFPSDSPWDVSVGGTVLSVRQDGSYLGEVGWEDPLTNGGGGGGVDSLDPRPSWQRGRGVTDTSGHRLLPDVSAAAGVGSPWAIYADGRLVPVWGTSAATPFWAASMLLVQQYLEQRGAGPLCFAAPLLYAVASTPSQPAFHDVVRGGNRYYAAGPGWDASTGLGSPDAWNLARDLAAYRKAHPLPATGNACRAQLRGAVTP